jgi:hypothetical protein
MGLESCRDRDPRTEFIKNNIERNQPRSIEPLEHSVGFAQNSRDSRPKILGFFKILGFPGGEKIRHVC